MLSIQKIMIIAVVAIIATTVSSVAQKIGTESNPYIINPTPTTIAWGNYWSEMPPALRVRGIL